DPRINCSSIVAHNVGRAWRPVNLKQRAAEVLGRRSCRMLREAARCPVPVAMAPIAGCTQFVATSPEALMNPDLERAMQEAQDAVSRASDTLVNGLAGRIGLHANAAAVFGEP